MRAFYKITAVVACGFPLVAGAFFNDYDAEPHGYWDRELSDVVSRWLEARDGQGSTLRDRALVEELLAEFDVPVASQVVVFSKTSLQRRAVGPENPRAMYFSEDVYLGWMPGGRIEIASADPELGLVFYFEDLREAGSKDVPVTFERARQCLECHAGAATNFLPGPLARSVYPDAQGRARGSVKSFDLVSHRVPVADRWGGWYVTGGDGLAHLGNMTGDRTPAKRPVPDGLGHFFDLSRYPLPTSDALALLVFDHQMGIHKQIIESHYRVRQAAHDAGADVSPGAEEWKAALPAGALGVAQAEVEKIVADLLFAGEAGFEPMALQPDQSFVEGFRLNRREDTRGRSLKDFAVGQGRLFAHRCSYMIYSRSFQGLPEVFRKMVYSRLVEVLEPGPVHPLSAPLPVGERAAVLAILRDTVDGFPL